MHTDCLDVHDKLVGMLEPSLTDEVFDVATRVRDAALQINTLNTNVDPRIVAGLIDRPELADPGGSRREMTILFCDMQNFTVQASGRKSVTLHNSDVTLDQLTANAGTALVIHAKADDMMTDPSGNSGDRIACGEIK